MDECKPLPRMRSTVSKPSTRSASRCARRLMAATSSVAFHVRGNPLEQGLTLGHFPAQLDRFLWDRGCA